jgi:translation elongation factor EF-G
MGDDEWARPPPVTCALSLLSATVPPARRRLPKACSPPPARSAAGAPSRRAIPFATFDPQEKEFGHSLNSALASFSWQGVLVHLIDTPGFPDFAGQAYGALAAVETALVVINAQNGIELSSERMMRLAAARGVCRMIVINKIDADNVDLPALVGEIRERFGRQCMLLDLPAQHGSEVVEVARPR